MESALTRVYRGGVLQKEGFGLAGITSYLADTETLVWVDLRAPTKEQLEDLGIELGFHELAIEDALVGDQRPKLNRHDGHLFLSCQAVRVDLEKAQLIETEIDSFVGDRWLVTVRENDDFNINRVLERWDRSAYLARYGVGFLLYGLLGVVVDGYFSAIETFDDYYEDIGDQIFASLPLELSQERHWFDVRRAMVRYHRVAVPMREIVSELMRGWQSAVPETLYSYYQDVYDHTLRVSEASDLLRDLMATIVETNISLRGYPQSQIVKKVNSWAAIIAVPTFITGYYGMNVPFPGSGGASGVVAATALIVISTLLLYTVFRRRDWL